MNYTLPVVSSLKTCGGECTSGIGTLIVVNDEGWFITANHIITQVVQLGQSEAHTRAAEQAAAAASRADRRGKKLGPRSGDVDKWSVWWGIDGVGVEDNSIRTIEVCDLAVAKFANFDPARIAEYPVFKDPNKDFEPGESLCRLGFPFYDVGTQYEPEVGFRLTNVPMPIFANEGILARMHEIHPVNPDGTPIPGLGFPLRMIETSSPGIKGQSGGPIFDNQGAIWALQSATMHLPLEFEVGVDQYYHVGVGVSSAIIVGFLQYLGIKIQVPNH